PSRALDRSGRDLRRGVQTASDVPGGPDTPPPGTASPPLHDAPPIFTSAASLSGAAKEGSALTAVAGGLNDSDASVSAYQWQSSANGVDGWSDIAGATGSTYTAIENDETEFLRVVETASDSEGGPDPT